jgi:hypothetical protein
MDEFSSRGLGSDQKIDRTGSGYTVIVIPEVGGSLMNEFS